MLTFSTQESIVVDTAAESLISHWSGITSFPVIAVISRKINKNECTDVSDRSYIDWISNVVLLHG